MPRPLTFPERRKVREAARWMIDRYKRREFSSWAREFPVFARSVADATWALREPEESWRNVSRLNTYLARRRVYEAGGDPWLVYAAMPFLGDKARPDDVMQGLLNIDHALRTGEWESVEVFDTGRFAIQPSNLDHHDTTLAPYDGPMGLVIAGKEDGTNVPARRSKPLGSA